ncbi:MBL fold metallo-hydrolase [Amycolatopsis sp. CA-230715]|uniref:MBL fold metallo-hydrolase n=1 Tax=Amycolatopsis sp. CA-230715 TaxID=2745196 RepID=UPI001C021C02|nr:MBL fold metallo-hydrolase [Amycolatopsis sp. CA-230715]QWF81181.1 hypothetical protein HUW46_04607 [Amycolatopsis sp. CA-230715]
MSPALFVSDGQVRARPADLFPATTPEDWHEHGDLVDPTGRLVFEVGAFLVRADGYLALVDLGLGETRADTPSGASYRGGDLIANLAAEGVAPEAVDLVVFTHLHRDHVGWTSTGGALTFANARHVVHRAEWEHWQRNPSPLGPDPVKVLEPLRERIEFCVDGDELADGMRVIETPGHTPGHISVAAGRTVIAGDVLHSPAQLDHPQWCFGSDTDPERAAESRRRLLDEYGPDMVACGHFTR